MKLVNVNVDQIQMFVIINNIGTMINANVNAKNSLIMKDVIKDLFGTLVIVNVNVIGYVMLENIQIVEIVNAEKKLVDGLVEECSENIYENKMIYNGEILQLGAKFQTAMVLRLRFIWITNSSDHRRVSTANLLHRKQLPNPLGHQAYFMIQINLEQGTIAICNGTLNDCGKYAILVQYILYYQLYFS